MAGHPASREIAARPGHPYRLLAATIRALQELRQKGLVHSPARGSASLSGHRVPVLASASGSPPLNEGPPDRRRLYGRLAALFYAGSGAVALSTVPLPARGANDVATAAVDVTALLISIVIWFAPWERWPRWGSLGIIPPAFALIALRNTFGGTDVHAYGVFFLVAFVWIGMAHPPRTSIAMAPLAAAAYILPVFFMPGSVASGVSSAAVSIPVCVLVGEGIAWGVGRLEQIELALLQERERAEQLRAVDEMKDKFLSAVSHELRTPITICRGHLEVLDEGADKQEVHAVKEMLVDELGLMGRLVEDLATLAWLDDRPLLKMESLSLDSFVSSITAKAETILGDRVQVRSGSNGAMLRADPQRLTQAIVNLLQNAADHAKGDGPVYFRVHAEPCGWHFDVTDDGGGLPVGDEQAVFEPFSTGSSRGGGTGLGLSIVRKIAKAHGGESGVINRPDEGATFWIRIPR